MTYRISEIVEFMRNLELPTDGNPENHKAAFHDRFKALAERFPELQRDDFARAIEVLKHEYEAEAEESFQQERELARMVALFERHRFRAICPGTRRSVLRSAEATRKPLRTWLSWRAPSISEPCACLQRS
jgi:hypothetical protein